MRNIDTRDSSKYEECQQAYFQHLDKFCKTSNTDLWKFFHYDFFHDGRIESLKIGSDLKTIDLTLNSPNIKRIFKDNDYEYVSATFTCTFQNVIKFTISDSAPKEWCDVNDRSALFLYSEINTSPLLKKLGADFYSILIEMLADNTIWLEIVFSQVDVVPKEPLAFSLLEADENFEVPLYLPTSPTNK